jgi:hypothetical protein
MRGVQIRVDIFSVILFVIFSSYITKVYVFELFVIDKERLWLDLGVIFRILRCFVQFNIRMNYVIDTIELIVCILKSLSIIN